MSSETERSIQDEFLREYAAGGLAGINVKQLCANVPVARTTFYAHYQNVDEVLTAVEDRLIAGLVAVAAEQSGGNLSDMDFTAFFDATMAYIKEEWGVFRALLVTQPDRRFEEKWKAAIKRHFRMRYPEKTAIENYGLIAEMMASAVIGGYRYGLQHPEEFNAAEMGRAVTAVLDAVTDALR